MPINYEQVVSHEEFRSDIQCQGPRRCSTFVLLARGTIRRYSAMPKKNVAGVSLGQIRTLLASDRRLVLATHGHSFKPAGYVRSA